MTLTLTGFVVALVGYSSCAVNAEGSLRVTSFGSVLGSWNVRSGSVYNSSTMIKLCCKS